MKIQSHISASIKLSRTINKLLQLCMSAWGNSMRYIMQIGETVLYIAHTSFDGSRYISDDANMNAILVVHKVSVIWTGRQPSEPTQL